MIDHIILGLIQGITEFLPVSSSGHLVIFKFLLDVKSPGAATEIALHVATAIAVVIILFKELRALLNWRYLGFLMLGLAPAATVGFLFKDIIESSFEDPLPVGFFMILTGALLLATKWARPRNMPLNWWRALIIGLAQVCALLPGISRSGATIATALLLGVEPEEAFRFSFFMLLPAVIGSAILDAKDIASLPHPAWLLGGFAVALATGLASLWVLRKTLISRRLFWFAFYLFAVGAASLAFFFWR
ncbi:MAG: undecaprenyl-diphosphate phosphatase [candidate division WOR-3 bacterium]